MSAMARWADWTATQSFVDDGYHAKINILSHAYLYTGEEKYLRVAAQRVSSFVDHLYEGEDPRYRGMFVAFPSNLEQSYFMQEAPYYMAAAAKLGHEPEPLWPDRSPTRVLSREDVAGKQRYVFHARLRQTSDEAFRLKTELRGASKVTYVAKLQPVGGGKELQAQIEGDPSWKPVEMEVAKDGAVDYELTIFGDQGFFLMLPITYGQPDVKEVYPVLREGSWIGEGFRYYFAIPEGAKTMALRYQGRAWPIEFEVFDPSGRSAGRDVWIGWSTPYVDVRSLRVTPGEGPRSGWSLRFTCYGMGNLLNAELDPPRKDYTLYFAASPEKFFEPR